MGGRHQTFSRITSVLLPERWRSQRRLQKKWAYIGQQLLVGSLTLFVAEPVWSDLAIAPNTPLPHSSQLVTPTSTGSFASDVPPVSPKTDRKSIEEESCQPIASNKVCQEGQGPVLSSTTAKPLERNQLINLDAESSDFTIPSKSQLSSTIDSYQASDLVVPQELSLGEDLSLSGAIATTVATSLETGFPSPVVDDGLENKPSNQPSSSFLLSQEAAPPTAPAPASPDAASLEDCPLDPDLGCLRIPLPEPVTAPPAPIMYLVPKFDFFHSNNILSGVDPIDDGLIRPSLTLLAVPPLGPNTYFVASIEGALNRYFEVSEFNYDELRIRAGIFQRLSPTMNAEIGWTNQQLFISGNEIPGFPSGTRFLNDHAIRLEISRRDQLAERLSLSSFYQLRVGFAQPEDRSRILNILFLSLNYELTSTLQLGLDYQFAAANFTITPRTDIYHQILGRLTFNAFRNTQLSLYGGFSLGTSTVPNIDFNSYVVGVSMSVSLPLF